MGCLFRRRRFSGLRDGSTNQLGHFNDRYRRHRERENEPPIPCRQFVDAEDVAHAGDCHGSNLQQDRQHDGREQIRIREQAQLGHGSTRAATANREEKLRKRDRAERGRSNVVERGMGSGSRAEMRRFRPWQSAGRATKLPGVPKRDDRLVGRSGWPVA